MLALFKDQNQRSASALGLYEGAVAQARRPVFYTDMGVPDTLDGRFEMIALHVILLIRRFGPEEGGAKLSQRLFDVMFRDMERSLREIGIGDLSVPKHMKRMMNGFNGRTQAYALGLDTGAGLEEALRRNVYGTVDNPVETMVINMAGYLRDAARKLESLSAQEIATAADIYPDV